MVDEVILPPFSCCLIHFIGQAHRLHCFLNFVDFKVRHLPKVSSGLAFGSFIAHYGSIAHVLVHDHLTCDFMEPLFKVSAITRGY